MKLRPLQVGGSQEGGIRPGTENVPLACALGAAAYKSLTEMGPNGIYIKKLKDRMEQHLKKIPGAVLNSPPGSTPYVMNFSIPGLSTDEMVTWLSRRRIYVSGGSACSKGARSHVLMAMGLPEERVASALRVSFCRTNTLEEVDMLAEELARLLEEKKGSSSSLKSKN